MREFQSLHIRAMLRRFIEAASAAHILVLLVCATGHGAPLPADTDASGAGSPNAVQRLSDADLALSGPHLDSGLETPLSGARVDILGTQAARNSATSASAGAPGFDYGQGLDPGAGGSLRDSLRSVINVRRSNTGAAPAPARKARAARNADPSLDLGFTSNEWIRDSLQEVLTSVLSPSVNERGQASFSVLGMGEFSIVISGDRSEIAVTSGDDILVTARRPLASASAGAAGGGYADPQWGFGGTAGGGAGGSGGIPGDLPLRRALELAMEIATHPLTFIVYALVAGYALIWTLLSGRKSRRHRPALAHYRPRSHAVTEPAPAAPVVKTRKRIRVRRHRHRSKPSVHRS